MVTEEEVRRVAELANLELTGEECTRMEHDLNAILEHIAQLNELDTSDVPAMAQGSGLGDSQSASQGAPERDDFGRALRADEVRPSLDRRAALAAAPEADGRFFKVPKVLER